MQQIWILWHTVCWAWRHRQEYGSFANALVDVFNAFRGAQTKLEWLTPRIKRLEKTPPPPYKEAADTIRAVNALINELRRYQDCPPMKLVITLLGEASIEAVETRLRADV